MHLPVLCAEAVRLLAPERGGWFVDCTVGLGGHAAAVLESSPAATLLGVDRDRRALEIAARRLAGFGDRVRLAVGRFDQLKRLAAEQGIEKCSGVLADLGVSSMQLEVAERGFSFLREGPLDMRMGAGELTAAEIVNRYPEAELNRIFKDLGEERHARRVARAIVAARRESPISSTAALARLVERVKPRSRKRRVHPATQVFQALRIEVNQELDQLSALLEQSIEMLDREGRLVVISYHSLEDRLVKHTLRDLATGEIEPVTGRPRAESRVIEVLTKRPLRPTAEEIAANPRSRSARLRAARRL